MKSKNLSRSKITLFTLLIMKNLVLFLLGIFIYAGAVAQNEKKKLFLKMNFFIKLPVLIVYCSMLIIQRILN